MARGGAPLARFLALLVALAVAASAAGCGSSDGGDGDAAEPPGAPPTTADDTTSPPASAVEGPPPIDGAVVIAHRGASAYVPEHTFAAYDLALEQGADHLEQDLQMTADGVLVVLHDSTLDRTARGPAESCTGPVSSKTLEQIRQCDVGSWFNEAHPELANPDFVGLRIPTMEEVLDRYGTSVRYYVETKAPSENPGMEEALVALLEAKGIPLDSSRRVIVQSFSPDSLRLLHGMRPELALVQLFVGGGAPRDPAALDELAAYAVGIGPSKGDVDATLVELAHTACLDVHPYTVDDPAEMATLLAAGVDGMFTNAPDRLVEVRADQPPPPEHCQPAT